MLHVPFDSAQVFEVDSSHFWGNLASGPEGREFTDLKKKQIL